jgi:hypothetical protein
MGSEVLGATGRRWESVYALVEDFNRKTGANLTVPEFWDLNPALGRQDTIPPETKYNLPSTLHVPPTPHRPQPPQRAGGGVNLQTSGAAIAPRPQAGAPYERYKLASGEDPYKVAGNRGIALPELRKANSDVAGFWKLRAGATINLPVKPAAGAAAPQAPTNGMKFSAEFDLPGRGRGKKRVGGDHFVADPSQAPVDMKKLHRLAQYYPLIVDACRRHNLDPDYVAALMYNESNGQWNARSPKGALGLMQLMPGTARGYLGRSASEKTILEPANNIEAGVRYLKDMMNGNEERGIPRVGPDCHLLTAGYNAGPHRITQYGGIPPFSESIRLAQNVAHTQALLKKLGPDWHKKV